MGRLLRLRRQAHEELLGHHRLLPLLGSMTWRGGEMRWDPPGSNQEAPSAAYRHAVGVHAFSGRRRDRLGKGRLAEQCFGE